MPVKFPSKIRKKAVAQNQKAVCCDVCDTWVQIKCNKINTQTYNILKKRKGFLELHRLFQGCFSLLKIKRNQFLNNNSW